MTSIGWCCPRCRTDQSVGANLVAVYTSPDGPRMQVVCPDCTTQVDALTDVDTAAALVRAVVRCQVDEAVQVGLFRLELDVAGDAAAQLIGRDDG